MYSRESKTSRCADRYEVVRILSDARHDTSRTIGSPSKLKTRV